MRGFLMNCWFDIIKIDKKTSDHLKMAIVEIVLRKNNITGFTRGTLEGLDL